MRKVVIARDYTLDEMNSGFAYVDSMIEKIDKTMEQYSKGIGTSWERSAVKRYVDAEIKSSLKGRKFGTDAAFKIAINKAETFEALKKAFQKLLKK